MSRKALRVKTARRQKYVMQQLARGKKVRHKIRAYNRCKLCGRVRGYLGLFEICRICFRELANTGEIMGIKKASW